jgi:general secretion pathway protein H
LPQRWLDADTGVALQPGGGRNAGLPRLMLGPDPIIGPQAVVLVSKSEPGKRVRLATDGVRPFAVQPESL